MKMRSENIITSRGLPKTSQVDVSQAGDDGTHQAGWWVGKTVATNKERFIICDVGADKVLIDRATNLMWARDWQQAGGKNADDDVGWNTAIAYCNNLDFAGFTDWRLPNYFELASIVAFGGFSSYPLYEDYFINFTYSVDLWSSTIYWLDDSNVFACYMGSGGELIVRNKGSAVTGLIAVRGGL